MVGACSTAPALCLPHLFRELGGMHLHHIFGVRSEINTPVSCPFHPSGASGMFSPSFP